jgi:hypothetical protein
MSNVLYLKVQTLFFHSPDRWDALPEAVAAQPGLFSNILTFSASPRVCLLRVLIRGSADSPISSRVLE